jgi:hypothetical protein
MVGERPSTSASAADRSLLNVTTTGGAGSVASSCSGPTEPVEGLGVAALVHVAGSGLPQQDDPWDDSVTHIPARPAEPLRSLAGSPKISTDRSTVATVPVAPSEPAFGHFRYAADARGCAQPSAQPIEYWPG